MKNIIFNLQKIANPIKPLILTVMFFVVVLPFYGFGPQIRQATKEEVKERCDTAKIRLENADDTYVRKMGESSGQTVTSSNLGGVMSKAEELSEDYQERESASNSVDFWCKSVKPGTWLKIEGNTLEITQPPK